MVQREQHPHAQARELALQFLYQCEIEKLYFYSANHLDRFASDFQVDRSLLDFLRQLIEGVFAHFNEINTQIESLSEHWTLSRMPVIDRCILRMAAFEISYAQTPKKVVLNEAIELAKKFSTENSGAFVNGILDRMAQSK